MPHKSILFEVFATYETANSQFSTQTDMKKTFLIKLLEQDNSKNNATNLEKKSHVNINCWTNQWKKNHSTHTLIMPKDKQMAPRVVDFDCNSCRNFAKSSFLAKTYAPTTISVIVSASRRIKYYTNNKQFKLFYVFDQFECKSKITIRVGDARSAIVLQIPKQVMKSVSPPTTMQTIETDFKVWSINKMIRNK